MAPEALKFQWAAASDIWSFAVTVYQMLTCDIPWVQLSTTESQVSQVPAVLAYQLQLSQWKLKPFGADIPPLAADLIRHGLCLDANARPTANPYFSMTLFVLTYI